MRARFAVLSALLLGLASPGTAQQPPLAELFGDEPGDRFGAALRVTGDVDGDGVNDFIVGAPLADAGGDRRGKAWVFSGADRSVLHVFAGSDDGHQLGYAVDGAGDVDGDGHEDLVVGEPWPAFTVSAPGRAYVYSGADGSTLFSFQGDGPGDLFGFAVAGVGDLDGDGHDDIAIGAPDHGCGSECSGRVVVYSGADGSELLDLVGWTGNMRLGWAVDGYGDLDRDGVLDFVVGAPLFNSNPFNPGPGAVFIISGQSGVALVTCHGLPAPVKAGSQTGQTVGLVRDMDGDGVRDVFGGGRWTDTDTGVLVVYSGATGAKLFDLEILTGPPPAASLGDVDGDGLDDLVLGDLEAPAYAPPTAGVVLGIGSADESTLMLQRGLQPSGLFGASVAVLGDADADGRPEILAGAPGPAATPLDEPGRVTLFEYAPLVAPALTVPGDGLAANGFGSIVRAAGDVDNDGAPDVISGEPEDSTVATSAGRARVHSGRDGSVLHVFLGDAASDRLGWAVDGAGDIDRDGFADVVVGIPFRVGPVPGAIRVYSGRTGAVLLEVEGAIATDRFGFSVAGVGDVDGDLVPDILVGAPNSSVAVTSAGSAYLVSGATGGVLHAVHGWNSFLGLGNSVGGGGDVDADGVPDLLVGVPNEIVGFPPTFPGTVHVYSGATGVQLQVLGGEPEGLHFGAALDDAGDVDGDGHDDLVIADPDVPSAHPEGKAYVVSGATFEVLWTHSGASGFGALALGVAGVGDIDRDGLSDVLVGVPFAKLLWGQRGEVRLLSGADGALIAAHAANDGSTGLGTVVDRLGDLDLDGRSEILGAATKAQGEPDGVITIWPTGDGSSAWSNLGAVLPGAHGAPSLLPSGTLVAGQPIALALGGALESAPAALVVGLSELGLPFKGGTLVPSVNLLFTGLTTDAGGALLLASTWPPGAPAGQPIYAQFWIADAAGLNGFAASNAVAGIVP